MPKGSLDRNRVPVKLGHKHSQGRYSMLELDEGKPSRPVLRRGDGSNSVSLAGSLGNSPGWKGETLGRGAHRGQGWVLREYTPQGYPTGRVIRWHPGGGHHEPEPYWCVSSGVGGVSEIMRYRSVA